MDRLPLQRKLRLVLELVTKLYIDIRDDSIGSVIFETGGFLGGFFRGVFLFSWDVDPWRFSLLIDVAARSVLLC